MEHRDTQPTRMDRTARRMSRYGPIMVLLVAVLLQACGQPSPATPAPTRAAMAATMIPTKPAVQATATLPPATAAATVPPSPTRTAVAATPTRAAAATPAIVDCPVAPTVCATAERLHGWLASGNIDAMVAATNAEQFTCPGPRPTGAGGPFPLCEGSAPGERRTGYIISYFPGERAVVAEQGYRAFLRDWLATIAPDRRDPVGDGRLMLATAGCAQPAASATPPCPGPVTIVISAIREGPGIPGDSRFVLLLFVEPEQDQPVQGVGSGMAQFNDRALLTGGTVTDFPWPSGSPGPGQFFPLAGRQ